MANEKIPSLGFHHIALQVKDFDRERAFLKAIGMKPYAAWMSGPKQIMLFEIGDGGMVELFSCGTEENPAVLKGGKVIVDLFFTQYTAETVFQTIHRSGNAVACLSV